MTSEKINNSKTIQTATQLSPVYQLISQSPITTHHESSSEQERNNLHTRRITVKIFNKFFNSHEDVINQPEKYVIH